MRMTDRCQGQAVDVLLVEDDPGDILMTREAFGHYKIRNELHVVTDGEQALQFLHRVGGYADAGRRGDPYPSLPPLPPPPPPPRPARA
jgi:CheY-like chemotaxis protein